jgi:DNA polymerase-1
MPEAQCLVDTFYYKKELDYLKSWIKECQEDERVRGRVMTLKTITGRMAHNSPNMAQVPAVYSPMVKSVESYGQYLILILFLVGTDASGLELRCLAHYMGNEKFTKEVLTGDIHTANMKLAGLY